MQTDYFSTYLNNLKIKFVTGKIIPSTSTICTPNTFNHAKLIGHGLIALQFVTQFVVYDQPNKKLLHDFTIKSLHFLFLFSPTLNS